MSKNRTIRDLVYYAEKSSDILYGAKPSGRPDAERFVRGDPKPWIQPQYSEERKKKILVFSNWYDINALDIGRIIKKGFTVYGCNGKNIFPITDEDCVQGKSFLVDKFGKLKNTLPNDAVIQLVSNRFRFAKDQIQVIDDYCATRIAARILHWDIDSPMLRIFEVKQFLNNNRASEKTWTADNSTFYSMLQSLTPKIDLLVQDEFSAEANAFVSQCRQHLKETMVAVTIKRLVLNENDLNILIKKGQLTLNNVTIKLENLSSLEVITLVGDFTNLNSLSDNLNILSKKTEAVGFWVDCEALDWNYTIFTYKNLTGSIEDNINEIVKEYSIYNNTTKQSYSKNKKQKQKTYINKQAVDPIHQPEYRLSHTPTKKDFLFEYKGSNDTLSQEMIIEKFSQYLTLTNQHCEYIPKLQDGMCAALVTLFNEMELDQWDELINEIRIWNGSLETITEDLSKHFKNILSQFKKIYVHQDTTENTYIGDNLIELFKNSDGPFRLNNPWHAISVKRISYDKWAIYDPNYVNGYKLLSFKDLISGIDASIGKLVSVTGYYNTPFPKISDIDAFIRDGGLLVLVYSPYSDTEKMLNLLNFRIKTSFSQNVLQGLLLRSVNGSPAWTYLIKSKNSALNELALQLLAQFIFKNPENYANKLIESLSAISEKEKYFVLEVLISISNKNPKLINTHHIEKIRFALHANRRAFHDIKKERFFNKQFNTWKKNESRPESTLAFCQRLVHVENKKCLIEFSSDEAVQAMNFRLQQYGKSINRPVLYIHSPEDLVCMAPFIKREGREGKIMNGRGGPLYDFLTADYKSDNPPLIIVNYNNFKAEDMVAFNTLLDEPPLIDKIKLPENAIVVGLINTKKIGCYQGEDFYSRFGKQGIEVCSLTIEQILPDPKTIQEIQKSQVTFPINLCHAPDWKERLLGRFIIKQDKLYFEDGILIDAIHSGLPIEIQNGLWEDESFRFFWEQALALNRISIDGKNIDISHLTFVQSSGYDPGLKSFAIWDHVLHDNVLTLNPGCFNDFFNRYQCNNETQQLNTLPGYIELHKGQALHVNVTRSLNKHEWAALLLECKKLNVKLQCHCTSEITLPKKSNFWTTDYHDEQSDIPVWNAHSSSSTVVINSTDIDTTIAQIVKTEQDWKVIDISECGSNDLLMRLDGKFNKDSLRFEFTQSACALILALEKNEKIILKGHFSQELADALAQLLLDRKANNKLGGKLILISNQTNTLNYLPVETHLVTKDEKYAVLSAEFSADKVNNLTTIAAEPLSHSRARLSYEAAQISNKPNPWQGTVQLPSRILLQPMESDEKKIKDKSEDFLRHRQQSVNAILDHSPFVFLTGLTGVGKSTFVENDLLASIQEGHRNNNNTNLYHGESAIVAWANDNSDKSKILFIDEANITSREWSEFEGLFQRSPNILIAGKYYPLTAKHKVIFAGNPLSYGGERKLAALFERHGNALVFEPLPQEFIYEKILKPVFEKSALEKFSLDIAKEILHIYKFLCECSKDSVLISPRELQMMALLVLSHHKEHPFDDPIATAQRYAYLIAKNCVPDDDRKKFETTFSKFASPISVKIPPDPTFLMTASREPLYQQLNDLTALREYRCDNPELNNAQKYGGLGGIVIEGEPGIGKSEFVKSHLLAHGYKEVDITNPDAIIPAKPFYHMPVGMSVIEKKKILLDAFDQGAIVIIDEINSSPMMERLLNDLLMGKRPKSETETDDDRPTTPGFMVIGTQNPITLSGRRVTGTALARRLINVTLPPYPQPEMEAILCHRGVDPDTAKVMVISYIYKSEQARREQKTPAPTFRDLLKTAKIWLYANAGNSSDLIMTDNKNIKKTISINAGQSLDDLPTYQIIDAAIDGIYDYLKRNKQHLDWSSSTFDSETGFNRAFCFLEELKDSHTLFYKFILLAALLSNSASPTLVSDVLIKMHNKFKFFPDLFSVINSNLHNQCDEAFKTYPFIANEYLLQCHTVIEKIRVSVNKTGEISKDLKNEILNLELVINNPKNALLITNIIETLSKMMQHIDPNIKALAKLAQAPKSSWFSIREQCQPQANSSWSIFATEPRDTFTNLLCNSIANFEKNLHANGKIKNLADLMCAEQNRSRKNKTSSNPEISKDEIMKNLALTSNSSKKTINN